MSIPSIPKVLKQLEGKSQEEKIQILRSNDTRTLRTILYIAFSKKIKINLPSERPEEIKLEEIPPSNLYQESRKFRIFVKGSGYDNLKESKRQDLFTNIIKSVSKEESELLLQIFVDKEIKCSLSYEDVYLSFNGLLPELTEKEKQIESSKKIKKPSKSKKKEEPVVEEVSGENVIEQLRERGTVVEEVKEEPLVYKNLSEVYEKNKPEEEPTVYKNLSEVYEKSKPKKENNKKSKNKKSSKKKSK